MTTSRRVVLRRAVGAAGLAGTTGLAAAASWAAAGCDGPEPSRADGVNSDPDGITWYASSVTQGLNDPRRMLVDYFERDNLDLDVRLIAGDASTDAMRENLHRRISAGSTVPDVYLGDVIWPGDFAADRIAAPLDDLLGDASWARFDQGQLDSSSYQGRLYAAPMYSDRGMLFYRTDLVEGPPATWQELADAARDARAEHGVLHGVVWQGKAYEGLTCCWTEVAAAAGAPLPTPEQPDGRLDAPEARQALAFLCGLVADGTAPREVLDYQELQAMQVFNAGDAVFMRGWTTAWANMRNPSISEVSGRVGVAPLPAFEENAAERFSTVGGWSLFLSPNSARTTPAARFVDWLTDVPAQKILARFAVVPTNQAVRADAVLTAQYEPLQIVNQTTPVFRPSGYRHYDRLSRAIHENVHAALAGDVSPDEALRTAQTQFDEVRRRS